LSFPSLYVNAFTKGSISLTKNLIPTFGFCTGKDKNKFEKSKNELIENNPIVKNANSYILLEVEKEVELETHTLFIGKIKGADVLNEGVPMTYKYYHDVIKGKAPKAAPTYIEEEISQNGEKYKCSICGYVYEGDINKENDDFICPICKQPKNMFVKL